MRYETWAIQDLLQEAGKRIRQERLNQNLTQEDLAVKAGISVPTVRNLESESPNPPLRVVLLVLRALGVGDRFDLMFPEPTPSPVRAARQRRETRQRASGGRGNQEDEDASWEW